MPPTLVLIRHAQALHNVDKDYTLHDPDLSELGRQQCQSLKAHLLPRIPTELDVGLILVSPMRRTIQTALLALGPLIESGVPIVAHAGWQENSDKPCDTGTPIPALQAEFPQIDFSAVDPVFPDKTSPAGARYAFTREAVVARGQAVLRDLHARPEKAVVVVSHSGFIRQGVTGYWLFNADYRVFDFDGTEQDGGDVVRLRQWPSTLKGGLGWSREEPAVVGEGLPEGVVVV